jgi:type I restriction-modification system DNA methylase subunit
MEKNSAASKAFIRRQREKFSTTGPEPQYSSSESINSSDEDFEVEYIKRTNRKMCKQIADRFMSFKHTSRLLMNPDTIESVSPFQQNIEKPKVKNIEVNSNYSKLRAEKTDNHDLLRLLHTVNNLKSQHRRTRSELDQKMMEIKKAEQEKKALKKELCELQDQAFSINRGKCRGESCVVF